MAVRDAAQLKAAAQALLTDAGPDYDIDPSEVRALLTDIVDSIPSLGLTADQARDIARIAALAAGLQAVAGELDALASNEAEGGFADVDGFEDVGLSTDPGADGAGEAVRRHSYAIAAIPGFNPPGNVVPVIWLPYGFEPAAYRVRHMRNSALVAAYPGAGQRWQQYGVNELFHAIEYELVDSSNENSVLVGARAGDVFQLQVATTVTNLVVMLDHLADAVKARLLPAGGSDGQILGRASGAPAWVNRSS